MGGGQCCMFAVASTGVIEMNKFMGVLLVEVGIC